MQAKLQVAFGHHCESLFFTLGAILFVIRIVLLQRLPGSSVPDHDRAGAVIIGRNNAFEVEV